MGNTASVTALQVNTINGLPYPPDNVVICEKRLNVDPTAEPYGPTGGLLIHPGITSLPFTLSGELGIASPFNKDPGGAVTFADDGGASKITINQDGDYEIGIEMMALVPTPDETYPEIPNTDSLMLAQVLRWNDTMLTAPPVTSTVGYYIPTTSLDVGFQSVAWGMYLGSGRSYAKLFQGDELKVSVLLTRGVAVMQLTSNITMKLLTPNIIV